MKLSTKNDNQRFLRYIQIFGQQVLMLDENYVKMKLQKPDRWVLI